MTASVPLSRLEAWLATELAAGPARDTVVLGGHFALFTVGAAARDSLDDASMSPGANADMIVFTRATCAAACGALATYRAAATTASPNARLLVLADDIQFVRPALDDRGAAERLGAALVENYRAAMPTLPVFHRRELEHAGLSSDAILRCRDDRWLFYERELREAAVRRLRRHASDDARAALSANEDGSMITVHAEGHDDYCLVHSGRTNCAGGYVELLAELRERGIERLIALVPMRCLGPITVGTTLALNTLGVRGLSVVNVAIPDVATERPAAISRHPL